MKEQEIIELMRKRKLEAKKKLKAVDAVLKGQAMPAQQLKTLIDDCNNYIKVTQGTMEMAQNALGPERFKEISEQLDKEIDLR